MSVAVAYTTFLHGDRTRVTRVIIRALRVRETLLSTSATLPAGTILQGCAVVRHHSAEEGEPYLVHFASGGRSYTCPLYAFQPRTVAVHAEPSEAPLPHAAIAV